jgi:hypothetical protein
MTAPVAATLCSDEPSTPEDETGRTVMRAIALILIIIGVAVGVDQFLGQAGAANPPSGLVTAAVPLVLGLVLL